MGLSTNVFLNKVVIGLGKIGNGEIKTFCIHLLYDFYKYFPPEHVRASKRFYQSHKKEIKEITSLLEDEKSRRIYRSMIEFRSTYDRKKHPDFTVDDIYFIRNLIQLNDHEIFVDAGGYQGDTVHSFLKNVKNQYDRIVVFEPDRMNFKELEALCRKKKNIVLHNSGLWSEKGELVFEGCGNECSKVVKNCPGGGIKETAKKKKTYTIAVEALDACAECKDATYIKMDIEGSEMEALKGAREMIQKQRPKLAISIYHTDSDMIEIPRYIHSIAPEYKLYVRQHSHSFFDTVLYAL